MEQLSVSPVSTIGFCLTAAIDTRENAAAFPRRLDLAATTNPKAAATPAADFFDVEEVWGTGDDCWDERWYDKGKLCALSQGCTGATTKALFM
jgi:hypothetical protein